MPHANIQTLTIASRLGRGPKLSGRVTICHAQFVQDVRLVFEHACLLGCEGIVSKRRHSRYRSGHSRDWVKMKNPNAPAVERRRLGTVDRLTVQANELFY